ncbi:MULTISPECIES: prevent-host-death protein [unclassified Nodularia (in: cyanobacteria)]|uniref:prevent-host-death protein n=1 Tax=unclassified Nodularia (in: cyanobacteria) TaxID=2656917 RepID=UPI00187F6EF0|nr:MULTISPECIES: prevent-host-death protein [unclassified Nodularia (in: cyanobacteria)]MBE9201990.1 prevent-host-death protein [Nodularia sp. LEGE 06071]MCC2693839.1 prevent-host-death protein [Nodularia sp. LEGE 04288]
MKWTLEEAKKQLSSIINATSLEPQLIYTQEELVAAIVDPELFQEFLNWRQNAGKISLDQVFKQVRQLCTEENYSLEIPPRSDRDNPFTDIAIAKVI